MNIERLASARSKRASSKAEWTATSTTPTMTRARRARPTMAAFRGGQRQGIRYRTNPEAASAMPTRRWLRGLANDGVQAAPGLFFPVVV
jgi:hypothetical protein